MHYETMEIEAIAAEVAERLEPGVTIDERYRLVSHLPDVARRRCFLAEDTKTEALVEIVMTSENPEDVQYVVRPHVNRAARELLPMVNRRAMETFAARIALTGISVQRKEQSVFYGWDRKHQRPVRIVIEPID